MLCGAGQNVRDRFRLQPCRQVLDDQMELEKQHTPEKHDTRIYEARFLRPRPLFYSGITAGSLPC